LQHDAVACDALGPKFVEEHPEWVSGACHFVVPISAQEQKGRSIRRWAPANLTRKEVNLAVVGKGKARDAYNFVQKLERRLVGPMEIVQEHHQRLSRLDAGERTRRVVRKRVSRR
jgi:hypothetical protein